MYVFNYCENRKNGKRIKSVDIVEIGILIFICILIFIFSTVQVKDIVSIWNQNDELGVWQGGAWLLGLDWSEVVTQNGYYGYGYGFILAFFIKFFGHNTILMTQMAIYFQAIMHIGCVFIARGCIKKMFPTANIIARVLVSSVCILSIPDLFYVYNFFSECLLRFIVWIIFGLVVSYSFEKKWYKLFLINIISVYSFSVHQRCILLIAMSFLLTTYELICYLIKNGLKVSLLIKSVLLTIAVVLFYCIEYRYAQTSYISFLYSADTNSNVTSNLLSSGGYTVKHILKDIIFNFEIERIAVQNMLGLIYYICAFDCGFAFYGFILCFSEIKRKIIAKEYGKQFIPYIYMSCMALFGILMTAYHEANGAVYSRVELMHYGRYCSYLLAPMFMFGMMEILTEKRSIILRNTFIVIITFLMSGLSTYSVLKKHNVTNLFAFHNACPGIKSIYYEEGPLTATLYHTLIGILWILIPAMVIMKSKKLLKLKKYLEIGIFVIISITWIAIANKEWSETYEAKKTYVVQTYDLQNILKDTAEFVAFKSYSYGSGLLQYNNVFSKIHVCQTLEEFGEEEDGLLVVSEKGIDEMETIVEKYGVIYENDFYFVWKYVKDAEPDLKNYLHI